MEKSEKRRFSVQQKLEPMDKPKSRRNSKMIKPKGENHNDKPPVALMPEIPENPENQLEQGNQGAAQIVQPINYPMQPVQPVMMAQYGMPVILNTIPGQNYPANAYISNQLGPMTLTPLKFGFGPARIACPYCQMVGETKIEESFNCCTCFIYVIVISLIPILLVLAAYAGCGNANCNNGCDCNCHCTYCGTCDCKCCIDTDHYCSNCGKKIGTRDSCEELCPCFTTCYC